MGVYILRAHAAGILYAPPPFYTPPTLRRVFSGVGGWGCIKFGPTKRCEKTQKKKNRHEKRAQTQTFESGYFRWGGGLPRKI